MKLILAPLFITTFAWAKPTVLVSYFDPFGNAPANNSEAVARLLVQKAGKLGVPFDISLCKVQTKFDVSFEELKDCVNALPERPVLVLGLGETGCDLKIELMGRNLDRTKGPDNAGVERRNTPIVKDAPPAVGFKYPLSEMYCSLTAPERKEIIISSNAGSFVCNNMAYQATWLESDLNFGFMHVPSHYCRNVSKRNEKIASQLLTMLNRGVEISLGNPERPRLPVTKDELEVLRSQHRGGDACLSYFYRQARAWDEKVWWDIFNKNESSN